MGFGVVDREDIFSAYVIILYFSLFGTVCLNDDIITLYNGSTLYAYVIIRVREVQGAPRTLFRVILGPEQGALFSSLLYSNSISEREALAYWRSICVQIGFLFDILKLIGHIF